MSPLLDVGIVDLQWLRGLSDAQLHAEIESREEAVDERISATFGRMPTNPEYHADVKYQRAIGELARRVEEREARHA